MRRIDDSEPDTAMVISALSFHPWDAMTPVVLRSILWRARSRPFRFTAETGCGGSTIVFSQLSRRHVVFAMEGENRTITQLRARADLRGEVVNFVEGETKTTVPGYRFESQLDFVLLDGPHAYPLPQIEFTYLFPQVSLGGWLALDDIQIPSVNELSQFLRKEPTVALEEVSGRTAIFRRTSFGVTGPDGWWEQGMNRRTILRYSWRDRLRKLLRKGMILSRSECYFGGPMRHSGSPTTMFCQLRTGIDR